MVQQKRWTQLLIGGIAACALAVGTLWGVAQNTGIAVAQSAQSVVSEETPALFQKGGRDGFGPGGFGAGRGQFGGAREDGGALLANALGITAAELQTAHETVFAKALEQAVAAGELTQAQADQMKSRGGFGMGGALRFLEQAEADKLLAEALGITVADLTAARDSMIDKGVEAGLLTEAQGNQMKLHKLIRDATEKALSEALAQAVKEGLITQQQADNMLKQGPGGFQQDPGFGGRGGRSQGRGEHGAGRGGFQQKPGVDGSQFQAPDESVTPSSDL